MMMGKLMQNANNELKSLSFNIFLLILFFHSCIEQSISNQWIFIKFQWRRWWFHLGCNTLNQLTNHYLLQKATKHFHFISISLFIFNSTCERIEFKAFYYRLGRLFALTSFRYLHDYVSESFNGWSIISILREIELNLNVKTPARSEF